MSQCHRKCSCSVCSLKHMNKASLVWQVIGELLHGAQHIMKGPTQFLVFMSLKMKILR